MPNSADALRRWLGAFCLAVAAGMLIWGQTILLPVLQGAVFLIYWALCFVFTVGAIGIALLDVRAVRRRSKEEQALLLRKAIAELERTEKEEPESPAK